MQQKDYSDLQIQSLYKELHTANEQEVQRHLADNPDQEEEYYSLMGIKQKLDSALAQPSKRSLNRILSHSRYFECEQANPAKL